MSDNISNYMIGTSVGTLVFIEDLVGGNMPFMESQYSEFQGYTELASGHEKGLGLPSVQWTFGLLTQDQRNALRTYCPGPSANIIIRTRINDSTEYHVFSGIMKWPKVSDERFDAGRYLELTILFQYLIDAGLYA